MWNKPAIERLPMRPRVRRRVLRLPPVLSLAVALSLVASAVVRAQTTFSAKPIHIFIPYGAGGVADLTMRLLAQKLNEETKQQVVIENRPGAGGVLAAKAGVGRPPDRYNLRGV